MFADSAQQLDRTRRTEFDETIEQALMHPHGAKQFTKRVYVYILIISVRLICYGAHGGTFDIAFAHGGTFDIASTFAV